MSRLSSLPKLLGSAFFIVACFCISYSSVWCELRIPPASPGGGGYLQLDGKHDYAALDFDDFGVLFEPGTNELTIEAWIYPTLPPNKDSVGIILSQQVAMYTFSYGSGWAQEWREKLEWEKSDLLLFMHVWVNRPGQAHTFSEPMTMSLNQWHHVAFQLAGEPVSTLMSICDERSTSKGWGLALKHGILEECVLRGDFVLGGYGVAGPISWELPLWAPFSGYIDEVRISSIPRYDSAAEHHDLPGRFGSDADTVALWHFDEKSGAGTFRDSSGNGYHLDGRNGATTRWPFGAYAKSRLITTWAEIKRNP